MKFIDFDFNVYIDDPTYFEEYLEIRYKQDRIKRSVILKEAAVYQSAFSIAKKEGLGLHSKIVDKFKKYYGLEPIDPLALQQLDHHFNNLFIGIYYNHKNLAQHSYQEIRKLEEAFSKTYIIFLFDFFELFYLINSEKAVQPKYTYYINNTYTELLVYQSLFTPKLTILFLLSGFSYDHLSLSESNINVTKIEELLSRYPKLKGYAYFRIAYIYHRFKYYEASIQYYRNSLSYLIQDINLQRATSIQNNLFIIYSSIGMLAKAKEQGETFLLYLNTVEGDEFLKWSINYNMALISIQVDEYQEALHYIETAYQYDHNKIAMLSLYMYICYVLKDRSKVQELYHDNQELIQNTPKIIYQLTIELIHYKSTKHSRAQANRRWRELDQLLKDSNNYNVTRYIQKLK